MFNTNINLIIHVPIIITIAILLSSGLLAEDQSTKTDKCVSFLIDSSGQIGGNRIFHHVDNTLALNGSWRDIPDFEKGWGKKRYEGTITYYVDWFNLSDPRNNFQVQPDGTILFKPNPFTKETFDKMVFRAGLQPLVVMGTATIPEPLIEGKAAIGTYGYQIRQPNDYGKWKIYLESVFQWLIDTYGKDQVKTWGFLFGIESDWQTRAVYPGTDTEMSTEDNRKEFLKMLDYFHAACTDKLGPNAYVGCYWALETQADDYIRHWTEGTNYCTGKKGTKIGFCGFSDWYHADKDSFNPFDPDKINKRDPVYNYKAGMVDKYKYITNLIDRYPSLRNLEIALPEAGYIDPLGGANPANIQYVDNRGASLYSLRNCAYAECARIRWAFNRYALGLGDLDLWYGVNPKAAVFHAIRIQKKLNGERQLPVSSTGKQSDPTNYIRVIASSSDTHDNILRVVAINYNDDIKKYSSEKARITIKGLPPVPHIRVRLHLIDDDHNNWWKRWKEYREANNIPYIPRMIIGTDQTFRKSEWMPVCNTVYATTDDAGYAKWLSVAPSYQAIDQLTVTSEITVSVVNGKASIPLDLPGHSVTYMEITSDYRTPEPVNLDFESSGLNGWTTKGSCDINSNHARTGKVSIRLNPYSHKASLTRIITGLTPNASYTFTAYAKSSSRIMDYGIYVKQPGSSKSIRAYGDYSGRWNRLVVTARADSQGRLVIGLESPKQVCESIDYILFDDLYFCGDND